MYNIYYIYNNNNNKSFAAADDDGRIIETLHSMRSDEVSLHRVKL